MFLRASIVAASLLVASTASAEVCVRPTDTGGYAGYGYGTSTVLHYDTPGVRVFYTIEGTHAVRATTTRTDGVPDDVAAVGATTEDALQRYLTMGFRAPVSDADAACGSNGGDGRLDVYLVRFIGADGMTGTERCLSAGKAVTCASFILAKNDFRSIYPTADEGIRTVLPHEAFHAVQNAYDAELDRFWAEGTAQWAAKELDPALPDLERFLPAFFNETGRSIDLAPAGVTAGFLYGAAIWPVFLSHHYDNAVIREIFEEEAASGDHALPAAMTAIGRRKGSLAEAWSTFWQWNTSTGARADGTGYPDAARYPLVPLRELTARVSGVTAGSTAIVYHAKPGGRVKVLLAASTAAHSAYFLPIEAGKARLDHAAQLPTTFAGEGLVVLVALATSKADAPFVLDMTAAPETPAPPMASAAPSGSGATPPTPAPGQASSGGCAVSSPRTSGASPSDPAFALCALAVLGVAGSRPHWRRSKRAAARRRARQ